LEPSLPPGVAELRIWPLTRAIARLVYLGGTPKEIRAKSNSARASATLRIVYNAVDESGGSSRIDGGAL
jgi:hypothetical protein